MSMAVAGVPGQYPVAVNTPLDRAFLRPLQEPLYDTECLNPASPPASIIFYQRPISQNDASGLITKTEAETNLYQSAMLDYPKEFSILGFNLAFDSTIGLSALQYIYRRAWFVFTFSGRRPYLLVPMNRLPQGVAIEGFTAVSNFSVGHVGMAHVANYYKFNLGRAALKIKPGEAFQGRIGWPATLVTADIDTNASATGPSGPAGWFVQLFIVGLSWQPL